MYSPPLPAPPTTSVHERHRPWNVRGEDDGVGGGTDKYLTEENDKDKFISSSVRLTKKKIILI